MFNDTCMRKNFNTASFTMYKAFSELEAKIKLLCALRAGHETSSLLGVIKRSRCMRGVQSFVLRHRAQGHRTGISTFFRLLAYKLDFLSSMHSSNLDKTSRDLVVWEQSGKIDVCVTEELKIEPIRSVHPFGSWVPFFSSPCSLCLLAGVRFMGHHSQGITASPHVMVVW